MWHQPTSNRLALAGLISAAVLLSACSSKPPSCGDEQTIEVIRNIAVSNTAEVVPVWISAGMVKQEAIEKLKDAYFKSLKAALSNVVSDGYNNEAKKHTCHAKLSFTTITGGNFSRDIDYTIQKTEGDEKFVVQVGNFTPFVTAIGRDLYEHYQATQKQ